MTINNLGPSSPQFSCFPYLPPEMQTIVLKFAFLENLLEARVVCKNWKALIDNCITEEWRRTKKISPKGVVPLTEMMISIEVANPDAPSFIFFRRLNECFNDTFGVRITSKEVPVLTSQISELQRRANDVEDQSLLTIWEEIQKQLNLAHPPQTPAEIRRWMIDPANIEQLNTITRLFVQDKNLRTIPPEIRFLPQLKQLCFYNNKITRIPDAIGELSKLEILNLANNFISHIPHSIKKLSLLRDIHLYNNKITEISEVICSLQLQNLYLSNNQITKIPDAMRALSQLQKLYLCGNKIILIPDWIYSLPHQEISLKRNPALEPPPPQSVTPETSCITKALSIFGFFCDYFFPSELARKEKNSRLIQNSR